MPDQIDLAAYFARIGYLGPAQPDLPTLSRLIRRHTEAIPFENLDALSGAVPRLDLASLQAKILHGQRGGYCFEQNALFRAVLHQIGFAVEGLVARVRMGVPEGVSTPRSHMMLRVTLAGERYLADVGFGGMVPTAPLLLDSEAAQETPNENFRLLALGDDRLLQASIDGVWRNLYRFDPLPAEPADYAMANFCAAATPGGLFTSNLVLSRSAPGERQSLLNARFTRRRQGQPPERRFVATRAEFEAVLREEFGVAAGEAHLDAIMRVAEADSAAIAASFH